MTEAAKPIPNQKLRYERERRGWSQQEVADKVGTTPLNVGRWERGVTVPGPHFRVKLSEVLEKSPYELGLVAEHPPAPLSSGPSPVPDRTTAVVETHAPLWNVPYNRNHFFTGREDILTHLHDTFLNGVQPVALTQPQAISGLGGIGKTQTAVEYAYRYSKNYDAVLWVRADSPDLLISDFLLIAALLNLPQRNEQEQSLVVKAVLRWFDAHEQWLLILDNADNLEIVSEFFPSSGKGHVLLTARSYSTGTVAQRIELEKMGLEEGMLFLLRRAKLLKGSALLETLAEAVRSHAQAIVKAVDGLPLALDQAGAYIEETGCSLNDYLKFYKTRRNRLLRMRGGSATGHPEPVATTWSLSFEKVEHANPAAAELLRLCAFLQPDEIPEAMIIEGASELGSVLQPGVEDELELNEAIGELRKYSLVKRDPDMKILNIHRLVQAVLKDAMDKQAQQTWAERTVKMVNKAFPEVEFAVWAKCQQYLPQAQICTELMEQWNMAFSQAAQLLHRVGVYLYKRGQYREAEPLLQHAVIISEQVLGLDHLDVAHSLNSLAWLYRHQNKYDQAEPLFQRALSIREQALGPNHLDVAESLNNLAFVSYDRGKYEQVEPLYLRALAIREQALGPDHLDVATTLYNLAEFYRYQSKLDQAELLFQRALSIREQVLEPNHPDLAESFHSLALVYFTQGKHEYMPGKYEQAEQLFKHALSIDEQVLGPNHPDFSTTLHNLAKLYFTQGKFEQAEPLYLRALAIDEQVLGPNSFAVARTFHGLAALYFAQGKYEQAQLLYQRSLSIDEQVLGPNHPRIATSLHDLAALYFAQGKYEQAQLLYQRSLSINEQAFGPNHPSVALTLHDLAKLYLAQGEYSEAETCFQRTLAIQEQRLQPEHPEIATILENYADLLRQTGRETESAKLEERAQAIRAK